MAALCGRGRRKADVMNIEQGFPHRTELGTPRAADERSPLRRRLPWIVGAAVLILIVAGIMLWRRGGGQDANAGRQALPRVTVIVPGRQPVASVISATGSLAARREMPVGVVGEGGSVARVLVEAGTWVAAGQTLAVIERSVQVQQTASLAASINVSQADAALAQSELDRAQSLVARGFISKADIDRKVATRDAAVARVKVAQAQLGESRAKIGRDRKSVV